MLNVARRRARPAIAFSMFYSGMRHDQWGLAARQPDVRTGARILGAADRVNRKHAR
jgi:hypothetical protein